MALVTGEVIGAVLYEGQGLMAGRAHDRWLPSLPGRSVKGQKRGWVMQGWLVRSGSSCWSGDETPRRPSASRSQQEIGGLLRADRVVQLLPRRDRGAEF